MGTNYYVQTRPCEKACDHCSLSTRVHLGKSSRGWKFTHRAYLDGEYGRPEPVTWEVRDRETWLKLLDLGVIYDEYGRHVDRDELLQLIERKQGSEYSHTVPGPHRGPYGRDFDADGYDFCPQEFS